MNALEQIKTRNKSIFLNFVILFISIAICIYISEQYVRIFLPWYNPARQVAFPVHEKYDLQLGEENSSSFVQTPKGDFSYEVFFNHYGLRDKKELKQSDTHSFFVVGDSFSFGWGVREEDRFSDQLAAMLTKPVFNIAIPTGINGYSDLVKYARLRGATINNLVIGICMANDIRNYDFNPTKVVKPQRSASDHQERLRSWIKGKSALYLMLSFELQKIKPIRLFLQKIGIARDANQLIALGSNKKLDREAIESSVRHLQKLTKQANSSYVVIIPSLGLWRGKNQEIERQVHEAFLARLREEDDIKLIDVTAKFEASGNPQQFYFLTDPHWNERGHSIAAQAIYEYLKNKPT